MSKCNLYFLLLAGSVLSAPAQALSSQRNAVSHIPHTFGLELKPISFLETDKSYQTASICFLGVGDCDPNVGFNAGDDYSVDTAKQCLNEGFVKLNCNSVQQGYDICPYNAAYGKGCKCNSNLVTCPAGQVGVGDSCGGQYASCQCSPALISCPSNKNGTGASCGGRYENCVCKSEYIYTSSNCTSPRSLNGASCDGKYTGCVCPSGVSSGAYGCAEYYASPCSGVCKTAYSDNCRNRTSVSTPYGCATYFSDCSSKCQTAYNDNCRNRDAVSAPYGCQQAWGDCQSKCQIAYSDNCRNRSAVSAPYGCAAYFSDCSSKCQTAAVNPDCNVTSQSCPYGCASANSCGKCTGCYADNCRNRSAVISSCPSNANCSYFSDCSSKIQSWSCKSGYNKSGNSCVSTTVQITISELTSRGGSCAKGPFSSVYYEYPSGTSGIFPRNICQNANLSVTSMTLPAGSKVTISAYSDWDYSGNNSLCKFTYETPYYGNLAVGQRSYTFTANSSSRYFIIWGNDYGSCY